MSRSVIAVTVVAIALAAVPAVSSSGAAIGRLSKPPLPRIVAADGADARAGRGTYCWNSGNSAVCADTTDPMTYAPTLRVPAGTSQVVLMRDEVASLVAHNRRGKHFQLDPLGDGGRRFRLTIDHPSAPHPTAVYLSADYGPVGDALFAIRIRPRN